MPPSETLIDTVASYLTIRIGQVDLGPAETAILIATSAAALLSAFYLWRIGKQEDRLARLLVLRGAAADRVVREERPHWYDRLGTIVAASPVVGRAEQQRLLGVLAAAGIKRHGNLTGFVASKVCAAFSWTALVWLFVEWSRWYAGSPTIRLAVLFGALLVGWRIPDFVLKRLAARRRLQVEQGIPDALDLLVICAEAGLSLDQAVEQVSQDLRASNPAVGEEFATTAAEMRVLSNRAEALENLVQRTGLASLRSITATLTQAIRFGTPLAESMRILAAEMRSERLLRMEERAARLPVLLALPLVMFILPSLLMVIGTPVVITLLDTFKNVTVSLPLGAP
jgi:tight adherence protein C